MYPVLVYSRMPVFTAIGAAVSNACRLNAATVNERASKIFFIFIPLRYFKQVYYIFGIFICFLDEKKDSILVCFLVY